MKLLIVAISNSITEGVRVSLTECDTAQTNTAPNNNKIIIIIIILMHERLCSAEEYMYCTCSSLLPSLVCFFSFIWTRSVPSPLSSLTDPSHVSIT